MNKLKIILLITLPALRVAVELLKNKDENSTGVDDEAAEALAYAITRLEKYLAEGQN
jgi:hypothetical protein